VKKLRMIITFDKELGLRRSKMKVAQNWITKLWAISKGNSESNLFPKFHRLLFIFYFFIIFGILFSISHIYTCKKNIFFLCFLVLIKNLSKNYENFLKFFF